MVLSIKDSETDAFVRQLAALTGEFITKTVFMSVKKWLNHLKPQNSAYSLAQQLDAMPSVVPLFPCWIPACQKS